MIDIMSASTGNAAHGNAQASRAPGSSAGSALMGINSERPHKLTTVKSAVGTTPRITPFCLSLNFKSTPRYIAAQERPVEQVLLIVGDRQRAHPIFPYLLRHRQCSSSRCRCRFEYAFARLPSIPDTLSVLRTGIHILLR